MSLKDTMRNDVKVFTSNSSDFGVSIVFVNADESETATINGLFYRHSLNVNREGTAFSGRVAHIDVAEELLTDEGYTVRDADGNVDFKNHTVTVEGTKYVVMQWYPSQTLGMITLTLGDYAD